MASSQTEPEFRYKSRKEGSKLVIDGKRYGVNDLEKLPQKLNLYAVSTKSNDDTVGFLGELCQFSNFYPVKFTQNGITYHSSEQSIQHQKALYCNNHDTAKWILFAKTVIACKQLSYSIQKYNQQEWVDAASNRCQDGLKAKFQ